jgi:hypothetical protein
MTRNPLITSFFVAAAVGLPGAVTAHHSTNMFDSDNPIELSGTVIEWQFGNPHTFIMLEVADEEGESDVWALEGLSPNVLYRQGWRPDSLRPGDEITATVRPLRSGAPGGNFANLRWADGTPFDPNARRPE